MRTLTQDEILCISGAEQYQKNISDGILVGGSFAAVSSMVGVLGGAIWYYEVSQNTALVQAALASYPGLPLLQLSHTILAGLGFGGAVGAITGFCLYYIADFHPTK